MSPIISSSSLTLLSAYHPPAATRDEMVAEDGHIRPHWQGFLHELHDLGQAESIRRWEEAKHLIRENGVTYNVYGDPRPGSALAARSHSAGRSAPTSRPSRPA